MAIKTKLIRRLLILAAAFALIVGGAGAFYVYRKTQIRRQYARWRDQGLADAAGGRNPQAIDLLGRYLQRYPDDRYPDSIDALVQYARLRPLVHEARRAEVRDTVYVLRHLLKLDPGRATERRQLLDLYVQTHYWTEALATADVLLPPGSKPAPGDVPVLAARTQALLGTRDQKQALVSARQWNAMAPADLDAQLIVLDLAHQTQNFQGFAGKNANQPANEMDVADALVAAAKSTAAKSVAAAGAPLVPKVANAVKAPSPSTQPALAAASPQENIVRGHACALLGRMDEAARDFRAAAATKPSDRHLCEILIAELNSLGLTDDSLAVLKRLEHETADPALRDALAKRSWQTSDWKSVADLLSGLTPADAKAASEMLGLRAIALTRLGRDAEAATIRKALARRKDDPAAAAWAIILQPAAAQHPVDVQRLSQACEQALQTENSSYLAFFLGESYARLGENDQAINTWRKSADRNATWAAPFTRMAQLLIESGRYESAMQAAREALRRDPHSAAAAIAVARSWDLCMQNGLIGQPDQLLEFIDRLQSQVKDGGDVLCVKADVLSSTGKPQEAAAAIRAALGDKGPHLTQQSLLQLAAISRKYKLDTVEACLDRCRADYGVTPQLAYAHAAGQFVAGHPAEGLKVFAADRAKAAKPQSIDWRLAWSRYLDLLQDPRAKAEIIRLADDQPRNAPIQLQALSSRSVGADKAFLERTISRVHELTGEQGVAWRLAQARWLLAFGNAKGDDPQIAKLLDEAARLAPDLIETHVLLSRAAQKAGRIRDAVEQMKIATGLSPNSVPLGLELTTLLEERGDFDAARDELNRVRALPSSDPAERRKAAVLAAQVGDPALALMLAQEAASQAPGTRDQDLLLAQMYWLGGNPAAAEKLCQALLARPDLPIIQFASEFYASQGRLDDATRVLSRLDSIKVDPGLRELVRADFAARHGSPGAAIKYLEQATVIGKTDPRTWQALIVYHLAAGQRVDALAAITRGLENAPNDPGLRALRGHARLLAAAATDPQLRPLAVTCARSPQEAAAGDALAALLAELQTKPSPGNLADQVKALADRYPRLLPLQTYLIQTYLKAGRRDDAANAASAAAHQFPSAAEPQALYVALLRDQKRWQEVLAEARKWRDRSMADPIAADLQIAQACLQLKRPADALRQLEPYVQHAATAPRAYEQVLPTYAAARQSAGQTGAAELMAPLLEQGPHGRQAWAVFAVENLDPSQAGAWLDRVEKVIPVGADGERVFLGQMWSALATQSRSPSDAAHARAILKPLADKPGADAATSLAMGMCEEQNNDLSGAEIYYRHALKAAPDNLIVKNNLAMVLAKSDGDLNQAAALVQSAIQQRADIPSLYDTQAFVLGKQRKYDDAVGAARKAIQIQPRGVQYRVTLAQLLLDKGNRADAARAMRDIDDLHADLSTQTAGLRQQIDAIRSALKAASGQASAN